MNALEEAEKEGEGINIREHDVMDKDYCEEIYQHILHLYEAYLSINKEDSQVLCRYVHKFRQTLRKAYKKFRKRSSNISYKSVEDFIPDDF